MYELVCKIENMATIGRTVEKGLRASRVVSLYYKEDCSG